MNNYRPHVLVLPEDGANADIANGFILHDQIDDRQIQILPSAGGWPKVRDSMTELAETMRRYQGRQIVLLVDFDKQEDRFKKMTDGVPGDLAKRVFVVGLWSEPEELSETDLGTRETLGFKLASECFDETRDAWNHELLAHNATELKRMTAQLRPILFPAE